MDYSLGNVVLCSAPKSTSATSDTCKTLGDILLGSLKGDDIIWMYKKYLH